MRRGAHAAWILVALRNNGHCEAEIARPAFTRAVTMFDAQIAVALFAAFLLGIVARSGVEILVRGGRH
jgi:hypothetical protein